MKKALLLATVAFLLSGCELIGGYLEDVTRERELSKRFAYNILGDFHENVKGKAIKAFEVNYNHTTMQRISFLVANGDVRDRDKLVTAIGAFLSEKYGDHHSYDIVSGGKDIHFGIGRKEWEYYKDGKKMTFSQTEITTAKVEDWREGIYVELICENDRLHDNGACDRELLENLFEKDPVAPLSPQAKTNWEELKSRF